MTTWRHLCGAESAVVGCSAAVVDGVEYVATHARNGDVQVLANDWRHSECRKGPRSVQVGGLFILNTSGQIQSLSDTMTMTMLVPQGPFIKYPFVPEATYLISRLT